MKFEYTGRHIEVTPALRKHVEDQFKKINHLINGDKPANAHVVIEVEKGGRHRSEIILNWRREVLTAETTNSDMYQSLTQTVSKLEKQALKIKNKVIDKSHRAPKKSTVVVPDIEPRPESVAPRIIAARRYAVKPMTADEAALMLSTDANSFLVFRNADDQRVAVIYKRKDGNFGLIQP
jgi:putative sigma-54 modulation protein